MFRVSIVVNSVGGGIGEFIAEGQLFDGAAESNRVEGFKNQEPERLSTIPERRSSRT